MARPIRTAVDTRSSAIPKFGENVHGFTHLEVNPERLTVRHLGAEGVQLHAFSKNPGGEVTVL